MAQVRCPDGTVVNADNPVALAYYEREPGYTVLGDEPPVVVEDGVEHVAAPPARSASKVDWYDYARGLGLDVPDEESEITRDELIALVEDSQES